MTLFSLDNTYDISVIEMGISKFNEMDILANIVKPDIAIITNIGHSHLEYLKSLENVFEEKFKITNNFSKNNVLLFFFTKIITLLKHLYLMEEFNYAKMVTRCGFLWNISTVF